MNTTLTHRGYTGSAHIDLDDTLLHGQLLGIQALVTYQANTVPALIRAFHEAVDDYLRFCHEFGIAPKVPITGVLSGRDYDNLVDHLNDLIPISPALRAAADRVDNGREDLEEIQTALKGKPSQA